MDDLNFLTHAATEDSTASLIVLLPDNAVSHIHNVAPFAILEKCPLLYHTFEFGANAARQANIEASSLSAVSALLRYLYTGDYLPQDERGSLINHAEVFKIAVDFDLPPLQVQAYVNFSAGTEYACCFVTPPPELCQTIRFVYEHLASSQSRQEQSLLDTLLHYCISMLSYQGLYKHAEFRQVILDLPAFHKDLCRQSMQRNFEDDGKCRLPPIRYGFERLLLRTVSTTQAPVT
ncbi:hypothetical protein CC80DRAFT_406159 [Byssothecium circinans]|uniref:BTB domain-containing protein n=1 Tax=Byssothecium circinans TaxID=147558 RepID=A0A6A5U4F1_9PLEO|nr:hypothetical protein CC80DRAFT_406159 [Byssothecium circinans]